MQLADIIDKTTNSAEWHSLLDTLGEEPKKEQITPSWCLYTFENSGLEIRYKKNKNHEGIREIWIFGEYYADKMPFTGELFSGLTNRDNREIIAGCMKSMDGISAETPTHHYCRKLEKKLIADSYINESFQITFYFLDEELIQLPVYICIYSYH